MNTIKKITRLMTLALCLTSLGTVAGMEPERSNSPTPSEAQEYNKKYAGRTISPSSPQLPSNPPSLLASYSTCAVTATHKLQPVVGDT